MKAIVLKLMQEKSIITLKPYYNGVHSSQLYTHQGALNLEDTVSEVMNDICLCFGSDLQGRINGMRRKFNYIKTPPILVSEVLKQVAIQLPSGILGEVMWIFKLDFQIEEIEPSKCKIIFDQQLSFDIPLSRASIETQRTRAINILYLLTYGEGFTMTGSKLIKR